MSVAVDLVLVDEARGDELVAEAESVEGLLKGFRTSQESQYSGSSLVKVPWGSFAPLLDPGAGVESPLVAADECQLRVGGD